MIIYLILSSLIDPCLIKVLRSMCSSGGSTICFTVLGNELWPISETLLKLNTSPSLLCRASLRSCSHSHTQQAPSAFHRKTRFLSVLLSLFSISYGFERCE
ncbi:hypothetical protein VNO80_20723 [Phaseolus coccineus]|uniref:Uncharacterized protein n=1 Tax=Phaseolus coccineus TaxID=3886 RepID=A0AAN9M6L5_PHACN